MLHLTRVTRIHGIMSNLTISIDEEVLKQARIRALKEGTSVNAEVRKYLETYSGMRTSQVESIKELFRLADENPCSSEGRGWTRDELYDRWERHHK